MAVNFGRLTLRKVRQSEFRLGALLNFVENAVTTNIAHLLALVAMSHSPQKFTGRLPFAEAALRWIADGSNLVTMGR